MPLVGQEFAGFRLRAVIGRGGMSVVYQAENPRIGSLVALKILAPELATNDDFRARFLQESRIAASLNHPNVIPIYDMGPEDDLLYIAMRYVAGSDLRAILKARDRLDAAQSIMLLQQVARALDNAHRHGLVHRDVKPANILVQRGTDEDPDHVYLVDFGISKHALSHSGLTATGEFLGTVDYIAPEQVQGHDVDGRADVYGLACVLFETLTGRVPFKKEADAAVIFAHVEETPPRPSDLNPDLPSDIDDVLAVGLSKNPDERYGTCHALIDDAARALGELGQAPRTVMVPPGENQRVVPGDHRQRARSGSGPKPTGSKATAGPRGGGLPPGAGGSGRPGGRGGPDDADETRGGRRTVLAVLGSALAVLLVVGLGVAWALLRDDGSPVAGPAGAASTSAAPDNHILDEVAAAYTSGAFAKGILSPSDCEAMSATEVHCTIPGDSANDVVLRTYKSLPALYHAYKAEAERESGRMFMENTPDGDCRRTQSNGEVSWNHEFEHPKTFSIKDHESGHLNPDTQAGGRVWCMVDRHSVMHIVWTENSAMLLGVVTGKPHALFIDFWKPFHHDLIPDEMHMGDESSGTTDMASPTDSASPHM
nr:serine/threonine-protein kinase [Nocardioides ginsengisegetis]